ncbi:hypothetical protein [Streptomyces sp. NPDC048106]|uniref:hypothetical protein n=1 Tax=Streptomyces sp. NPDC048106 TaxID=3155750 RepID=UPI003454F35B
MSGQHRWRQDFRPESAGSGAPPGGDSYGDAEERPDVETRELKPEELSLEPDVDRIRGANAARAVVAQQAYEASQGTRGRGGADREQEGRREGEQERDASREPNARDREAARLAGIVAQTFRDIGDLPRSSVNRVRDVSDVTPEVTQTLRRDLERRRGPGLRKDLGLE